MATTQNKPTLGPDDPRHGTWAGYGRGCRLDCCRTAARQYQKKRVHERAQGAARLIPARGTKRRLQALGAIGWDFYAISVEAGHTREWVWQVYRRDTVLRRTAETIDAVYKKLCMTRPEGWVADRARRQAAERGWIAPLWWDDIDNEDTPDIANIKDKYDPNFTDEVKIQRVLAGIKQDCTTAERYAVLDRWEGSLAELERITGWNADRMLNHRKAA